MGLTLILIDYFFLLSFSFPFISKQEIFLTFHMKSRVTTLFRHL